MRRYIIVSSVAGLALSLFILPYLLPWMNDLPAEAQSSTSYYVASTGNCGGFSPCYTAIQAAVDAAASGDVVKVAQGVYTSTSLQVVYIDKPISLVGGYSTTDWTTSYPITRPTVIDAESVARRRGVYIDVAGSLATTLSGLTVERGIATGSSGGGIYLKDGVVTLRDSQVLTNTVTGAPGDDTSGRGGGFYVGRGTLSVSGSTFRGNNASSWLGGALYVDGGTVILTDNTFQGNVASNGGAVAVGKGSVVLTGNTVLSNTASFGGGLFVEGGTFAMTGNTVIGNSAGMGGGVWVQGGNVALNANTFGSNRAGTGGGVFLYGGNLIMGHNLVHDNSASNGGGFSSETTSGTAILNGNNLAGNSATESGGGMYLSGGQFTLTGNAIISNTARTSGGAIVVVSGDVDASNDVIANNTSQWEGVYLSGGALSAKHWTLIGNGSYALTTNGGSANLTNTVVVSHTAAGYWGPGIAADRSLFFSSVISCGSGAICTNSFFGDPRFINPTYEDYHIGSDSAAIDVGIDAGVTTDFDSEPRPYKGYDVGADEYWPPGAPKRLYLPVILRQ